MIACRAPGRRGGHEARAETAAEGVQGATDGAMVGGGRADVRALAMASARGDGSSISPLPTPPSPQPPAVAPVVIQDACTCAEAWRGMNLEIDMCRVLCRCGTGTTDSKSPSRQHCRQEEAGLYIALLTLCWWKPKPIIYRFPQCLLAHSLGSETMSFSIEICLRDLHTHTHTHTSSVPALSISDALHIETYWIYSCTDLNDLRQGSDPRLAPFLDGIAIEQSHMWTSGRPSALK